VETRVKSFSAKTIYILETSINEWIKKCSNSIEGRNFNIINISHSSYIINRQTYMSSSEIEWYSALIVYKI